MFQSLHSVYSKLKRPSSLAWLNVWNYSTNNTWIFLSNELLSFYINSLAGFKSVTVTTFQNQPQIIYKLVIVAVLLVQLGLFLG